MGRLGPWTPTTVEERLDRMESLSEIRQLPYRYALALDSRDMDAVADLFVPDVRVGRDAFGRAALHRWYTEAMRASRTTIHQVTNHIVDFDDADRARGVVYCRDQLERPSTGQWEIGELQYWDADRRVRAVHGWRGSGRPPAGRSRAALSRSSTRRRRRHRRLR
jgi:ketosteroid isomerase-like protein